jgi:cholesterol transport system auxiliary component
MIQPGALQAQYLPDVRWSDPAPIMLQTLMLRALDQTRRLSIRRPPPARPRRRFRHPDGDRGFPGRAGPEGETAEVTVRMIVRIVRERGAHVVATRQFAARGTAASLDDLDLAEAFDDATGRVLSEFTVWTLSTLGAISTTLRIRLPCVVVSPSP